MCFERGEPKRLGVGAHDDCVRGAVIGGELVMRPGPHETDRVVETE
jgi:hypothetical protein